MKENVTEVTRIHSGLEKWNVGRKICITVATFAKEEKKVKQKLKIN